MGGANAKERLFPRFAGCMALALIAALAAFGQTPARYFEVSGVVLDPRGEAIAEAQVVLRRKGGRSGSAANCARRVRRCRC
jgi:hypothetical protein